MDIGYSLIFLGVEGIIIAMYLLQLYFLLPTVRKFFTTLKTRRLYNISTIFLMGLIIFTPIITQILFVYYIPYEVIIAVEMIAIWVIYWNRYKLDPVFFELHGKLWHGEY